MQAAAPSGAPADNTYAAVAKGNPTRKKSDSPSTPHTQTAALSALQPTATAVTPTPSSLAVLSVEEMNQLKKDNAALAERVQKLEATLLLNAAQTQPSAANVQQPAPSQTVEQTAEAVLESTKEVFSKFRTLQDRIDNLRNRCRVLMDSMKKYNDPELLAAFQPFYDQYTPLLDEALKVRPDVDKAILSLKNSKKPEKAPEAVDLVKLSLLNIEGDYDNVAVRFENCRDHMMVIVRRLNAVSWSAWWYGQTKPVADFKELRSLTREYNWKFSTVK